MNYSELMQAPLNDLAIMALDFTRSIRYRLAPWEAMKARAAEVSGSGWILLSPIERNRITRALALDLAQPIADSKPATLAA